VEAEARNVEAVPEIVDMLDETLFSKGRSIGTAKVGIEGAKAQWVALVQPVVANAAMVSAMLGVSAVMLHVLTEFAARSGRGDSPIEVVGRVPEPEDDEEAEP
jgi:hypothetical protein